MIALTVVVDGPQLIGMGVVIVIAAWAQEIWNNRSSTARYRKLYYDLLQQMSEDSKRNFDRAMAKNDVIDAARRAVKWPSRENTDALYRVMIKYDAQHLYEPEGEPVPGPNPFGEPDDPV